MNNDYLSRYYDNVMGNYYNPYYRMYKNPIRDYGPEPFVVNIEHQ